MALLDSEIARIKAELGYNVLSRSATPYVDIVAIFEQVIQPYVESGPKTTSSTPVNEGQSGAATLILADATGFATGQRVVVDVDSAQEIATVRHLNGSSIQLYLAKSHLGTYPVAVEGPESIVREILGEIRRTREIIGERYGFIGLSKVDEVEFADFSKQFGLLGESLMYYRRQLAAALGIRSGWDMAARAGSTISVY